MARLYGIKKRLPEYGVNESQAKEIIGNGELTGIIRRMEELLAPDIVHEILDSCACWGKKETIKQMEKTRKENADKTASEKISQLINSADDFEKITLNADNTVTVTWSFTDTGKYICQCPAIIKKGTKVSELALDSTGDSTMPLTYCFCCAGSCRLFFQAKSGIELKTKEIISSPINSKGEKPCSFVYDIG